MGGQACHSFIYLGHYDLGAIAQKLTDVGQFELAAATFEQELTYGLLKPGNMLRQRRLCLVKQFCRMGHRPRVRHCKKDSKLVKRERRRGHQVAHQAKPAQFLEQAAGMYILAY